VNRKLRESRKITDEIKHLGYEMFHFKEVFGMDDEVMKSNLDYNFKEKQRL